MGKSKFVWETSSQTQKAAILSVRRAENRRPPKYYVVGGPSLLQAGAGEVFAVASRSFWSPLTRLAGVNSGKNMFLPGNVHHIRGEVFQNFSSCVRARHFTCRGSRCSGASPGEKFFFPGTCTHVRGEVFQKFPPAYGSHTKRDG